MNDLLLYGLPRSGTNYLESLINKNFAEVVFHNEHYPENLPTHKHFRLYDEKHLVPGVQYLNQFFYPRFEAFETHTKQLTGVKSLGYVVVVKNPYAWYKSYYRWAHKRPRWKRTVISFLRKEANAQFMLEWNLFMKKWMGFQNEHPDKVMIVRYEDLVADLEGCLKKIQFHFGLTAKSESWINVSKVGMSKAFDAEKKIYYESAQYIKDIPVLHFRAVTEALDRNLVARLGYEWLPSETTISLQSNHTNNQQ